MIDKILRAPLPDQLKALLEKLDNEVDASSLKKINDFVRLYARYLTRYERMVFRRSINRINRHLLMEEAMAIVINLKESDNPHEEAGYNRTVLTAEEIQRDTMRILSKHFDKTYTADPYGAQAKMYTVQAKAEGARVNY